MIDNNFDVSGIIDFQIVYAVFKIQNNVYKRYGKNHWVIILLARDT